jgi:signal peptidase II
MRRGLAMALLVILLDQASKWWIVNQVFRPAGIAQTPFFTAKTVTLAPFFDLVMAWNRGVSFGMFNSGAGPWNSIVFSAFAAIVVAALIVWMRRTTSIWVATALGMVAGGAIGNAVDRLRYGAVADFLDVHAGTWHWPAFNVADSAITVGAMLLIADSLFRPSDSSKK